MWLIYHNQLHCDGGFQKKAEKLLHYYEHRPDWTNYLLDDYGVSIQRKFIFCQESSL